MIIVFAMIFGLYLLVLLAIISDLVSGVRKAKQRGEARTSYGLKRTIDKLSRYYNGLFAITIVDLMQMIGVWYLDGYYEFHIPLLPLLTFVGAIFIGFIEVKSIYEKADDKVKNQSQQVLEMMGYIAGNKDKQEEKEKDVEKKKKKEGGNKNE